MKPDSTAFLPEWNAMLELGFQQREGATIATRRRHTGPLRVQKSLYPEGAACCHQIILHPPGGIAGGDQLKIAVDLGAGAHALLTSPGAAKWYRSAQRPAGQTLRFKLARAATLEWLPQETLLFSGCEAHMDNRIELDAQARLMYLDVACLGRPASGERFEHGGWHQHSRVYRGARLIWSDQIEIHGNDPLLVSALGLGGHSVLGTLLWAGPALPDRLHRHCRALRAQGLAAVSQLPEVWLARYLGDSTEAAQWYLRECWRRIRPWALGRAACSPRIWTT